HPLDAQVDIYADDELYGFLSGYEAGLAEIMIVSEVNLHRASGAPSSAYKSEELPGLMVVAIPASSEKCERCWGKKKDVGTHEKHPTLCARCAGVLEG
ncbi:MAG TPA: zinc finger domain-containing protein, partial [Nitrospirota bacterium]